MAKEIDQEEEFARSYQFTVDQIVHAAKTFKELFNNESEGYTDPNPNQPSHGIYCLGLAYQLSQDIKKSLSDDMKIKALDIANMFEGFTSR